MVKRSEKTTKLVKTTTECVKTKAVEVCKRPMGAEQLQRRLNEVPCVHITVCACTFLVSKRPMDAEQLQRWLNEVPCVHITVCACTFLVSYRLDVSSRAVRIDSHESFILSLLPIALKQHAIISIP